jgi:acyl-CoA reductase-like NAD-dependent aldehyde dehydrogenase
VTEASTLRVRNPRTGRIDAEIAVPSADAIAVRARDLRRAQSAWSGMPIAGRGEALEMWARKIEAARGDLLEALCHDTGRYHESALEFDATLATLRRWAAEAPALLEKPAPRPANVPFIETHQGWAPFHLVGVISPWNFPMLLALIDAAPALMAGSAVLIKPSEVTPRFIEPLRRTFASLPELGAVLDIVPGAGTTGAQLIEQVDLVCFTGSVRTGRQVGEAAARRFIPAFLELGGKDPAIVLEDADIARAARAICWGGMVNAGQSCMSIERVYVVEPVADAFLDALVAAAKKLRFCYPDMHQGEIGPVISAAQVAIIEEHLADAKARGARALVGGHLRQHGGGFWCEPTVLDQVDHRMKIMNEETFAAILPVMRARDEAHAIELANDSIYGLSASVFAGSIERAERVARRLEAGAVSLNDAALTSLIHTGEKQSFKFSGLGGSRMGPASIRRFVRPQAYLINRGVDSPWWF